MCVAVIVESENRISKEYLKAMSEANPHGAGIAWYSGKGANKIVRFRKGMTWEDIDDIQDLIPRPFLMHFRIATRGEKIPELTHPFPIGFQAFSEDLIGTTDKGVIIHNGTWSDFHKYVPEGIDPKAVSDTQVAAFVVEANEAILQDVKWSNAFMTPHDIRYRGNWTLHEGNLYSNMHWRRELITSRTKSYEWEHDEFYRNYPRTTTPIEARKKGKSHQEGRHQENGRSVGQYQTQFNKTGKGVHVPQSNGKTLQENREAKKNKLKQMSNRISGYEATRKTQPLNAVNDNSKGESPYDKARNAYKQSMELSTDPDENMRRMRGHDWENDDYIVSRRMTQTHSAWNSGEPLFTEDELKGSGVPEMPSIGRAPTLTKYLGPSVPCPFCKKEITQIPCSCGMDSEEELEQALASLNDDFNVEVETADFTMEGDGEIVPLADKVTSISHRTEDGVPIRSFNADGEQLSIPFNDLNDVEDMNAYGMTAGLDGIGADHGPRCGCGCAEGGGCVVGDANEYLDPDWKDIDAAIRASGIKIVESDT